MYSAAPGVRYFIYAVCINLLTVLVLHGVSSAAVMPDYEHLAPITNSVNGPMAVALDREGRLYVAEAGSGRVVILSRNGRYIAAFAGPDTPVSVAVDDGGRILVGSKGTGSVHVYAPDFTPLFKLGSGDGEFSLPNDICIDSTGRIYVVDRGRDIVRIYDAAGRPAGSLGSPGNNIGQFHRPVSITIDEASGEIIVLDRQLVPGTARQGARVQFFTLSGGYLRGFTRNSDQEGGMVTPQGITVDAGSRIYVTDSYQNAVLVYDNTGIFLSAVYDLDNPLRAPLGAAIDGTNRLSVASRMANSIETYGIDDYTGMEVDPLRLAFTAKEGAADPSSQGFTVRNSGNTTIAWEAAADQSWLSLSDDGGVLARDQAAGIDATVDPAGLAPGEYTGRITVSAGPGATGVVQIVLTVAPSARLSVAPAALSFASEAGTPPDPVTLTIANTGAAPLHWSIATDLPWLEFNNIAGIAAAGAGPVTVTVTADGTGLAAGTHTGTITVTGREVLASPAAIGVTLTLTGPAVPPRGENPPAPPPGTEWKGNPGRKWTVVSQLQGTSLNGIWGSSGSDIFAIGDSGAVLHYDGKSWNRQNTGISTNLNGVWGASATSVYVVGDNGLVLRYDGENLADVSPPFPGILRDVWCGGKSAKCLAVGQNAGIVDVEDIGSPGSAASSSGSIGSLNGIWGSSESDLYAVGDSGTILHYDGNGWTGIATGCDSNLHGVWGSGADNVFAVGQDGTILHYNGAEWTLMDSDTTVTLNGIWGNAADEVYAVGEDGTMLLFQGARWQRLETGIAEDLNDAWGGRRKEVYAVGSRGSIIFGRASFPWGLLPVLQNRERTAPAEEQVMPVRE